MYPSQTSLIPVAVSLSKFFIENGFTSIHRWYPYWYLGVPFRYLTGPVVPLLVYLLDSVFTHTSLFTIIIYLTLASLLTGIVGWAILINKINKGRMLGFVFALIYAIMPWKYFQAFYLDEASFVIARNFLPFCLILVWNLLGRNKAKEFIFASFSISFLFLINTSILPILIVGLVTVALTKSFEKSRIKGLLIQLKLLSFLVVSSLLLVTFVWYTPNYWWTILTNPSLGGNPVYRVIYQLFNSLRFALPIFVAVFVVYFNYKFKEKLKIFTLVWLAVFIFLTVYRMFQDIDFWMDWVSWFFEIEIGVALILSISIYPILKRFIFRNFKLIKESQIADDKTSNLSTRLNKHYLLLILIFLLPFYFVWRIHKLVGTQKVFTNKPPEIIKSVEKLSELAGGERVFISGSGVFWVNSLYNLNQVRGGVDKVSIHPLWQLGAYQIREGNDSELTHLWLKSFGVEWVLVHGGRSSDYFKDFRNLDKWDKVGEMAWEGNGDRIYKIVDSGLVWGGNITLNQLPIAPQRGDDLNGLQQYIRLLEEELPYEYSNARIEIADVSDFESIIVLITFDKGWEAFNEKGNKLNVLKDSFGHMIVETLDSQRIFLQY